MKPLNLSIQAFGPFAEIQEIDFTRLGDNPLFLINGPTGAGKSSILDAICFALYGKTTADEREASEMRCDQALANTSTEVTLDFSLAGKKYRVTRAPQQQRPKARGEGFTVDNGFASFWEILADGELRLIVAKKLKEVTQEIETITGLNVEQFRQVMVLPQGKFRELLLADSKQREKIFGQLFQTHIYKRIEEELHQQASTIYVDVKNLENQVKGILQAAEVSSEQEIQQLLDSIGPDLNKARQQKEKTQQLLQEALRRKEIGIAISAQFKELETTQQKIAKLELRKPEIKQKQIILDWALKAEKIKPLFNESNRIGMEYQQLKKTISENVGAQAQASRDYQASISTLQQAKESFAEVDPLKQQKQLLEQYREKIMKLEEARQQSAKAQQDSQSRSQQLTRSQQAVDDNARQTENLELKLTDIQQAVSDLANRQVQLAEYKRHYEQRRNLEKARLIVKEHTTRLGNSGQQLEQKKEVVKSVQQDASRIEMLWHSGQAASLAQQLETDQPCPVCGSTEHPSPAQPEQDQQMVTREEVDSARSGVESVKSEQMEMEKELNTLEVELQQYEKNVEDLKHDLAKLADDSVAQVEAAFARLKTEVSALEKQQRKMEKINDELSTNKSSAKQLQLNLTESRELLEQARQQEIVHQSAVRLIVAEIPEQYQSQAILIDELQQLSSKIELLTQQFETASEVSENFKIELNRLDTILQELNSREKHQQETLIDSRATWQKVLEESVFDSTENFQESLLSEKEQQKLTEEISQFSDQSKELNGAFNQQQKELEGKKEPDIGAEEKACLEMEQNYNAADQQWHELDARLKPLKTAQLLLSDAHKTNKTLEERYAIYGTLSDVANGRRYNKLSLQRFVLSVLLDDVLLQASQRLSLMSKGRYRMLRKDERAKGNRASGLELEVEDAYTGKNRSVATLSGGESFMAALALALGLSDVVQAYAGGIKLDTLFIDEGFGSLDQESLDLAIRTLIDLQATGRMIGIISHVSELKEQMALRLDVISSKTGSHVNTVAV